MDTFGAIYLAITVPPFLWMLWSVGRDMWRERHEHPTEWGKTTIY